MRYTFSDVSRRGYIAGIPVVGNIATGGFILLSKEGNAFLDSIQEGKEIVEDELNPNLTELLNVAIEEGILSSGKDVTKEPSIVSAYLHVTNNCNLHCVGCYSNDENRNSCNDMTLLQIKQIIDVLHEQMLQTLLISGGEPFIRDDIIDILKYAKEKIPTVIVGTNGTRITADIARDIKGIVDNVSLSIDGFSINDSDYIRDKGTFAKVIEASKHLKAADVPFSLLPTIHQKNFKNIKSFLDLAKEMDVPIAFSLLTCNSHIEKLVDFVLSEQDFVEFVKSNCEDEDVHVNEAPLNFDDIDFKISCGAGISTMSVDARGFVYPCHMLHIDDMCAGNVLIDSWEGIRARLRSQEIVTHNVEKVEMCRQCDYKYFCGGGCKARTLYAAGCLNAPDMYCEGMKVNFKTIADSFVELASRDQ